MEKVYLSGRLCGQGEERADNQLEAREQWHEAPDVLPRRRLTRFAPVAALGFVLIAACASAFSMLIWEPAAGPPTARPAVVQSGQRQPGQALPVENIRR